MKKLLTLFVFLVIASMTTACGSPIGLDIDSPDGVSGIASEIECPQPGEEGWPSPNSFLCGEGEG